MLMLRHGFCHVETAKARVVSGYKQNQGKRTWKKMTSCEPTPSMFDIEGMGSKLLLVESM